MRSNVVEFCGRRAQGATGNRGEKRGKEGKDDHTFKRLRQQYPAVRTHHLKNHIHSAATARTAQPQHITFFHSNNHRTFCNTYVLVRVEAVGVNQHRDAAA